MKYILHNTDIFDEEIGQKLKEVIIDNKDVFIKEKTYKFIASFHVNLLEDERFEKFEIPVISKANKRTAKDKIYDVMSYQLQRMEQVLDETGIETYSTTIQGDYLNSDNTIKIEILEDNSEPTFIGRGKGKSRMKIKSIIPNLPFTQKNMGELASKRINDIYDKFSKLIKYKKLMSDILEIDETEDDKVLFNAFVEQYGELWLTTSEREKELIQQLKDRAMLIANKYKEQLEQEKRYEKNNNNIK